MSRLIAKMVFSGLVMACRRAICPTSRSPPSVKATDRRGDAAALGVGDHDGVARLHDRHARIRGSQIDSNDFRHYVSPRGRSLIIAPVVGNVGGRGDGPLRDGDQRRSQQAVVQHVAALVLVDDGVGRARRSRRGRSPRGGSGRTASRAPSTPRHAVPLEDVVAGLAARARRRRPAIGSPPSWRARRRARGCRRPAARSFRSDSRSRSGSASARSAPPAASRSRGRRVRAASAREPGSASSRAAASSASSRMRCAGLPRSPVGPGSAAGDCRVRRRRLPIGASRRSPMGRPAGRS